MGIKLLDKYSLSHFLFGGLSFILLKSINIKNHMNFILANGFHLFMELNENNISPSGQILESIQNHISDILLFFLGWLVTYILKFYKFYEKLPVLVKSFIWILFIFEIVKEIYIEINPYSQLDIMKGAFVNNDKK